MEFSAYYHKFKGNYKITMAKGHCEGEIQSPTLIPVIDVQEAEENLIDLETVCRLSIQQYKDTGFCILSKGSLEPKNFIEFGKTVANAIGGNIVTKKHLIKEILNGPGRDFPEMNSIIRSSLPFNRTVSLASTVARDLENDSGLNWENT